LMVSRSLTADITGTREGLSGGILPADPCSYEFREFAVKHLFEEIVISHSVPS
jgi:hypothetical protein